MDRHSRTSPSCQLAIVLLLATFAIIDDASAQTDSSTVSPLVTAVQLEKLVGNDEVRILEVGRDAKEYTDGHIPSALFVHWIDDLSNPKSPDRFNNIDRPAMEKLLSRLGIQHDTHIVLYDELASRLSTRMYWSLKYYGHDRVSVLDGGQYGWVHSKRKLSREKPKVKPTKYVVQKMNPKYAASAKIIMDRLGRPNLKLVDGRPPKQFTCAEPGRVFHTDKPHKRRGHIPGASSIFWKQNFNKDGTFKSEAELRKLYSEVHQPGATIVTYCNEGLHAAPPWFVLHELLGAKDVRVYDDSMSEWANSDRPLDEG
ncbi:MAG: sulfurtransferase [Planctomycetota bacterium]